MELRADVPAFLWDFDNLHKVGGRVDTHALHTVRLIFVFIGVVEFIAMPVPLMNY
jgi:hypothetical protein